MEAKGGEGKGGGGPRFVLPEEDEVAASSRLRSTSPRNTTNTSKAKEEEREDEKQWTVAELRGWAARLDQRERAVAEREASLDQRAQWLDQQQARVFRMSVERYHALQALDDQAVLRMQTIVRAWLRRRQWLKNMIRMKSCDDEAIVKMRRRASALKEIVISEQSYIRSLQVLLMEFLVPIVEGGVLKDDEHMGVSFIIGHVLSVNKQFHVAMQKKYAQWPTKHSFAEVFLEHIPLMKKAYANYIAVFDHITAVLLDHSNKKKSPLSAFLEEKMTKGGLDLKAYLIMPVQRLPRYEILLTELIKNTFPEHSDYEQLQKALAKVKKMNSYVDLKKREIDIKKEFLQIQQRQEKKVDHYIKQGKGMTLTTFSDLRELLTNKKQGDTPDRPRRDKSAAPEKERAFSKTSMLKVCILEGRHLTPTTHDEAPNPYCVVTVGKQSYKSKKKTKTFHPSWSNATFVFDVNDLQGQVEIECWDANNLIKTEMLGRVALNIADVITLGRPDRVDTQPLRQGEEDEEGEGTEIRSLEGKPRWCSLMDPEYGRSKTGELRVSFHYMRAEEEVERLRLLADAQRKREDASGEHVTHMVVNKANHAARRQQHLRQHSTSSGATAGNDSSNASNASDDDASLLSTSSDVYDNQEGEEWERPLSRDGSVIVDTSDHHHHGVDSSKTRKKEKRKSTTLKEMLGEIKKKGNTLHRRTRSVDNKQSSAIDTGDRPEAAAAAVVAREKASEPGSRGSGKKEKRKTGANAPPPSKMSTPGVVGGDDEVSTTPSTAPSPGSGSGSSVSSSLPAVVAGGRCSPTTARRIMSSDSVVRGPHMPEHPEEAPEEWELSAQITLAKGRTATATTSSGADDVDAGEKPTAVPRSRGSGAHKKNAPAPAATASATIAKSVSDSPRSRSPRPSSTYTPASPSSSASSASSASSVSVSASFSSVPVNSKEERLTLRLDAAKRHEKQEKEKEKEKAKEKKAAAEDKKERKREDKTEKNEAKKPSDSAAAPVSAVQLSPRAQPPPEHRVADQPSPPPPESSSSSSGRDKAKEATETTAATIATVGLMTASGGSGSGSGSGSSGAVPCSPKGRFLTPEELAEVIREKRAASPRARLDLAAASKKKKEEEAEAEAQKEEEEKRRKKNETGAKKNEDEGEDEEETDSEDERSLEKARAKARRLREKRSFQRDASSSSSDESD